MVSSKRKQYGRSFGNMAKRLRLGVGGALRLAQRYRGNGSSTSTRTRANRGASYGNLTFQQDERTIYQRKRAPRRVRRQHRRAFKNFQYNMDKLQSMRTAVIYGRLTSLVNPTGVVNGQGVLGLTMYGYNTNTYGSNIDTANGDMGWVFSRENGGYPTVNDATRKLRFRSCVLEVTIRNELTAEGEGDVGGIMLFDIYYVIARKNNSNTSDPAGFWTDALLAEGASNMPTAITANTQLGVTPFDASQFGKYWLIKKKRRVRLSPGQFHNFQMRDPGNYTLQMNDLLNLKSKSNLTEGIIVVGQNAGYKFLDPNYVPGDLEFSITYRKTYHYTETLSSQDAIGS